LNEYRKSDQLTYCRF